MKDKEIREVQDMEELKDIIKNLPVGTMVIIEFGGKKSCSTD